MKRYFPSIKRYAWVILVCMAVTATVGIALAKAQPVAYQATTTLFVDAGAPGTTYPGQTVAASDSIGQAANDAAEIISLSVMNFTYQTYPEIKARHYTPEDLVLDVSVTAPSTTTSFFTLTATASKPADAMMIANDVSKGYQLFKQKQLLSDLLAKRANLQSQINTLTQQKAQWEAKIASLATTTDPHYTIYNNDLTDITHSIDGLETTLQSLPPTVNSDLFISQLAVPSAVVSASKSAVIVGATVLVGLVFGLLLLLLLVSMDNRLLGDDLVREKLGLAYLGGLATHSDIRNDLFSPTGVLVNEFADLCANLRLTHILPDRWQAPQGAVLLVTSSQIAEGKSTISVALASTVARGGGTVVVVDGNLRRPSTHLTFGINAGGIGLSGFLKAPVEESVDVAVMRSNVPNVWLVPGGAAVEDPSFALAQKLPAMLLQLRKKADLTIIDGPALLESADAALLATMVDGVAVVIDSRHDKMPILLRTKEIISSLVQTPAGIIMNRKPLRKNNRYFAMAMPSPNQVEQPASVQSHESNGNGHSHGNGNGLWHEMVQGRASIATPPLTPDKNSMSMGLSPSVPPVSPTPVLPSMPGLAPLPLPSMLQMPASPRPMEMTPPPVRPGN